jgi:hypothetical protein
MKRTGKAKTLYFTSVLRQDDDREKGMVRVETYIRYENRKSATAHLPFRNTV